MIIIRYVLTHEFNSIYNLLFNNHFYYVKINDIS